jgi:hypothetical protein
MALPIVSHPYGLVVAEIDLSRGVLSALKANDGGHAYIVDGNGHLVAYDQGMLTMSKLDSNIPSQIAAALSGTTSMEPIDGRAVDRAGAPTSVRSTFADIPNSNWKVVVDVPATDYEMPIGQAEFNGGSLAAFSAVFVVLAIIFGFRPVRLTRPLSTRNL